MPIRFGACVVTFRAVSGGLFSVAWTDFLSAALIVLSLLVILPIVLAAVGGPVAYGNRLPEHDDAHGRLRANAAAWILSAVVPARPC